MPRFEVHGYGRDTGRKRRRVYSGRDEDEALQRASDDATVAETITRLPDTPATEAQKQYATDLGLSFPADISKEAMTELLGRELGTAVAPEVAMGAIANTGGMARIVYWEPDTGRTEYLVRPESYVEEMEDTGAAGVRCWRISPSPQAWQTFELSRISSLKEASRSGCFIALVLACAVMATGSLLLF